jgi:hypothetical protein
MGGFNPKMCACPFKFWEIKAPYIQNDRFIFEFVANARNYYTMRTLELRHNRCVCTNKVGYT